MDLTVTIASSALGIVTTGIVLLNEVALVAAPWIVAPSAPSSLATPFPNPLTTSLAYACLEPLWTELLAGLGVDPWIYLLASVQYLWTCQLPVEYIKHLLRMQTRSMSAGEYTTEYKPKDESDAEHNLNKQKRVRQPTLHGSFVIILPLISVAGSNAALVLFAADLEHQLVGDGRAIMTGMSCFALLIYLGSRFGDYLITQAASKIPIWQLQPLGNFRMQCLCLALILLVKISIRTLLGHSMFPTLQIMGLGAMEPKLAKRIPGWLKAVLEWKPPWPWPWWAKSIMNFATGAVQVYGLYLYRRGLQQQE